jgi:thioredoxin-related protein
MIFRALIAVALMQAPAQLALAEDSVAGHPEASPFNEDANAKADVEAALARARANGKLALIVLGANWCHDSRALAGWFEKRNFTEMLGERYVLVYVDVGMPQMGQGVNMDIARRFGFKKIKGTPTVLIVDGAGKLLNKKTAPTWRNAASRSGDDIFRAFAEFTAP